MDDSKVLLLEQKFNLIKEQTEKEIEDLKKITDNQEKRIIQLEKANAKTDLQYEQIMQTLNKLNEITIPNLTAQIEELKNKPVKRYDQIVTSILGAICGAIGGYIVGLFI